MPNAFKADAAALQIRESVTPELFARNCQVAGRIGLRSNVVDFLLACAPGDLQEKL
jgi:hypothetical protein